jgi:hypothetical protein
MTRSTAAAQQKGTLVRLFPRGYHHANIKRYQLTL